MWELYHKENWVLQNWCFWTVVLEKTLESPLDCKEIKLVNPKGNQSWIFIGRTGAEAPILWPPDAKNWLIGKDPDAGQDWRQEEKGMTEDEMVGWYHQLDGHGFGVGQGSLACYGPWGCKWADTTERLNWTDSDDCLSITHLCVMIMTLCTLHGCESCTIKKAECWRIDAFELWCWRRLLRVP